MSSENTQHAYAIISTGGKQYTVKNGDKIRIELISGNTGDEVKFSEVLYVQTGNSDSGSANLIGKPLVAGATVIGKILGVSKDDKTITYKKRRRKRYVRKVGHRQQKTDVLIESVSF